MNREHLELLRSDLWRDLLRDQIVPYALGELGWSDLGPAVLEVGPGPGLVTDVLVEQSDGHVTALELDKDLAAELEQRLGTRIRVQQGDATEMPFEDGQFTGVVSFTMLHHVPSTDLQDRLLAEVHRVLGPGGVFVASDSVASPDLAALHSDDVYNPVDPDTVAGRLESVGFIGIGVRRNDFGWAALARRP